MPDLAAYLDDARTIAIFGASTKPYRTSRHVAAYLQGVGYRIVPINPNYTTVLGERCYPDLASVPDDVALDIVDIFRRDAHTADAVRQVVAYAERTGRKPVVWTQMGVHSPEAQRLAEAAGLPYVADACTMAVHSTSR